MESQVFKTLYCEILKQNHLEQYCVEPHISQFEQFLTLFFEENQKTNLSAIRKPAEAIAKHIADCLLAAEYLPKNASVLDIGCGGGFPTVPWAIVRPDLRITALDSTQKKLDCVARMLSSLNLQNVSLICGRAEDGRQKPLYGSFDIVAARAVANLRVLAELTLPFVRTGGLLIALKGAQGAAEVEEAKNAFKALGGKPEADIVRSLACPILQESEESSKITGYTFESRHILMIRKEKSGPPGYPRSYPQILKRPL